MLFPPYIKDVEHNSALLYDLGLLLLYTCPSGTIGAGQTFTCCTCEISGFSLFLISALPHSYKEQTLASSQIYCF